MDSRATDRTTFTGCQCSRSYSVAVGFGCDGLPVSDCESTASVKASSTRRRLAARLVALVEEEVDVAVADLAALYRQLQAGGIDGAN